MTKYINKAQILGYVGQDPIIRDKVALFSISTSKSWNDKKTGEKVVRTTWHKVKTFSPDLILQIRDQIKKGSYVQVEGEITNNVWERPATDTTPAVTYETMDILLSPFEGGLVIKDLQDSFSTKNNFKEKEMTFGYKKLPPKKEESQAFLDDDIPF